MTLPAPLVEAIRGAIAAAVAVDEHELAACTEEVVHQVTAAWPAALAATPTDPSALRELVAEWRELAPVLVRLKRALDRATGRTINDCADELPAPLVEMASTMYLRAAEIIREDLPVSIEAEFVRILTDAWPAALASLATPDLREAVEGAVEAAFAAAYDERSTATHVLATVAPIVEALRAEVAEADDVTATLTAKIIAMQAESRELRAVWSRLRFARALAIASRPRIRSLPARQGNPL